MVDSIQTVTGPVSPDELGVVLPHEHILVDFSAGLDPHALLPDGRDPTDLPISMENMGFIRRFPYSVRANIVMDEVDKAIDEVRLYNLAKGGAICEMSVVGMRCADHQPVNMRRISMDTGVRIISATGFYCEQFLPDWVQGMSVRDMAGFMMEELVQGKEGVRCGVMYIGCSYPLREIEKKSLEAAAITHKETGIAMAIHPGRVQQSPFEILDLLSSHGVPSSAICMSHMDRTFSDSDIDLKKMSQLCQRGCYVNHSLFGKECSHYKSRPDFDFPSDAQKVQRVKALVAAGCLERLLISHDIVCKHEWTCYGGTGYAHLLEHIVPKFVARGVDLTTVNKIMTNNTKNWLTCLF